MENAENGASQLTLSTDVNENTETGFSLPGLTTDASESNVSADKGVYKVCFDGKKDSDERNAEYATGRGAAGLHGGDECSGIDSTMLGFVAKGTSGGAKNNCVTSERHIDSSLNRVTESVRQSMVESTTGGRGTSAGSPSGAADVADCQPDTDEAHPRDFAGTVGQPKCNTDRDMQKDTSNSNQEIYSTPHLSPSCDGHEHQQICRCQASQPEPLTLRNGNMNDAGQLPPVSECQREPVEKVGNVKMANGEVISTENRVGLEASTQPRVTEACLSNPPVENPLPHAVPQSSRTECRTLEPCMGELLKEDSAVFDDSCTSPSRQIHGDDPVPRVELTFGPDRETSVTARPQSLKSITHSTHFLSCDSTPLSPERSNAFLRTAAERDIHFMDVNLNSRNTYEISRRQSVPDNIPGGMSVASAVSSDQLSKQKKHGISDFFGRGLFSKKQCEQHSAPGWKLFGKVPPRENNPKDSRTIQQDSNQGSLTSVSTPSLLGPAEYEAKRAQSGHSPPSQAAHGGPGRRKNLEFEPLSTTALILEDRPANLPAKSSEEAQRHRQEYDEMVAEAKKRELKEAQRKKKMMKERFKQEESIASAMVAWNNEILPNWESMRGTRRVRELWWQGLPPNVRGKVWSLAIGNELNITPELYEIFLSRAKERWRSFSEIGSETETEAESGASVADRESSLDVIKLDISRTFPSLFIFQKGGPYHDVLHSILGAYTCYRPDVGYVQGMSFIAAVLILNLEEADAFIAFANLLNKPCQLAFFRVDHELMMKYFAAFEVFFEENLPRLFSHFKSCSLTPDLYLIDWIFTLYSRPLPLDVACRVWDVFCRDGEEFLFRTGLGILRLFEDVLLQMDFIHMAQFLTRLPDHLPSDALFTCIAATQMLSGNRKWAQVFSALMKDSKDAEKTGSPALKSS
ncbi:TBC1 domain family member 12 isoform X1 [Alosa sapidissima]|uniref:TBC1 domain family member 12 isoform X1 n=1 Tax=Alosa sapidissima TaxID=34773 RepID=UPI001C09090D|nr:TBC1 domain family member 12 isoform X1 [Alosa sapidissima]